MALSLKSGRVQNKRLKNAFLTIAVNYRKIVQKSNNYAIQNNNKTGYLVIYDFI